MLLLNLDSGRVNTQVSESLTFKTLVTASFELFSRRSKLSLNFCKLWLEHSLGVGSDWNLSNWDSSQTWVTSYSRLESLQQCALLKLTSRKMDGGWLCWPNWVINSSRFFLTNAICCTTTLCWKEKPKISLTTSFKVISLEVIQVGKVAERGNNSITRRKTRSTIMQVERQSSYLQDNFILKKVREGQPVQEKTF